MRDSVTYIYIYTYTVGECLSLSLSLSVTAVRRKPFAVKTAVLNWCWLILKYVTVIRK